MAFYGGLVNIDFNYRQEFPNIAPMQAYNSVISWLEGEGAAIKENNAYTSIVAFHGSRKTVSVWKRDAKKKLVFDIRARGRGTEILIRASPGSLMYADDVGTMKDEIFVNWGLLTEEIWRHIEGKGAENPVSQFQKANRILAEADLVRGKAMIRNGAITLAIGLAIFALFIAFYQYMPHGYNMGLVVLPVLGLGWIIFGIFKMRWGR